MNPRPTAPDDHLTRGSDTLDQFGYPRDTYWAASAGHGSTGEPQVLVLGRNHLEIVDTSGQSILDAGLREIRSLRPLVGTGLEIYVTPLGGDREGFRPRHWVHMVADEDANCLDKTWLQLSPSMHNGIQLNTRPWREEEYAYYVGRVLTEAAHCEVKLASVLMLVELRGKKLKNSPRGASGSKLVKLLKEVGEVSEAVHDIAVRYEAWFKWRNFSAHGIRLDEKPGHPASQVSKMKQNGQRGDEIFEVKRQNFQDLAKLWRAFYALSIDATHLIVQLTTSVEPIEETLSNLPMPNSVAASESLPPESI